MKPVNGSGHGEGEIVPEEGEQSTIQQLYEHHLRENERRLREAERMARLGHWELDIKNNKLHWSAETFRIFELDPLDHEPSLETFAALIHPNDRNYVLNEYRKSVENRTQYNVYHRVILKSGATKFLNERCRTHYDENEQPVRSFGTVLDMTDHKRVINQLLKAESSLQTYANGMEEEIGQLEQQLTKERAELESARALIETLQDNIHHRG